MLIRRIGPDAALLVVLTGVLGAVGCTGSAQAPGASRDGEPAATTAGTGGTGGAGAVATKATVGTVAGRLDPASRTRVRDEVAAVVDDYLDAAYVGGTWPRDDFTAAFADFRERAVASATTDLDLLTNHDIGTQVSAVQATHRRVRIDVLSPGGRASAATARFALEFTTAGPVAGARRVDGSLYLTRQHGAWKVFGYDVRKGTAS